MSTGGDGPSWAGEPYTAASAHHRTHDDWFLGRHAPGRDATVVDAGCGSGEFTTRLAGLVDGGHVVGVEPDASMLAAARRRGAGIDNLSFSPGRLQDLDVVCGEEAADLVVSRAVFHWVPLDEYEACYAAIRCVLRPGGWLHAESGAAGNIRRVTDLIDDTCTRLGLSTTAALWQPDPGTARELLERVGYDVDAGEVCSVAQRRRFDRGQLLAWLDTQVLIAYAAGLEAEERDALRAAVMGRIDELRHHDGSFDQIFVRLHVLARRPGDDEPPP